MLSFGFRIFCWYRGFCHRTGSDLLLFLHRTFATDVACRQETLTPPDLVPSHLGLAYVVLVEANPFHEFVVIFRTLRFEHPSVLSRLSFVMTRCLMMLIVGKTEEVNKQIERDLGTMKPLSLPITLSGKDIGYLEP